LPLRCLPAAAACHLPAAAFAAAFAALLCMYTRTAGRDSTIVAASLAPHQHVNTTDADGNAVPDCLNCFAPLLTSLLAFSFTVECVRSACNLHTAAHFCFEPVTLVPRLHVVHLPDALSMLLHLYHPTYLVIFSWLSIWLTTVVMFPPALSASLHCSAFKLNHASLISSVFIDFHLHSPCFLCIYVLYLFISACNLRSCLHHVSAGYQQQPQQGQQQQESYVLAGLLGNYGGGDD
jgi:hypothetical protein